jgi:hypothetical protein
MCDLRTEFPSKRPAFKSVEADESASTDLLLILVWCHVHSSSRPPSWARTNWCVLQAACPLWSGAARPPRRSSRLGVTGVGRGTGGWNWDFRGCGLDSVGMAVGQRGCCSYGHVPGHGAFPGAGPEVRCDITVGRVPRVGGDLHGGRPRRARAAIWAAKGRRRQGKGTSGCCTGWCFPKPGPASSSNF